MTRSNDLGSAAAPKRWSLEVVLLVFALLLLLAFAIRYRHCLVDDTYISLRYARNLVEGHGLVFNPGCRPGFSGSASIR